MPCFDAMGGGSSGPSFSDLDNIETKLRKEIEDRMNVVKDELNIRTAQLCELMLFIELNLSEIYKKLPTDLREWHSDHKLFDKERQK